MKSVTGGHADPLPHSVDLHVHEVVHLSSVTSTMDEAHARATRGAPAGTLIVADHQTAGRGRGGNVWESEARQGIWCTLIERPTDAAAVDVLSIRLGLAIAKSIEPFASSSISLKWPNDLYVGTGKLAGILVEARWREGALDWVAIGIGVNLTVPRNNSSAAALVPGTSRNDVLLQMIPAVRNAAHFHGILSHHEQDEWALRDLAVNRAVTAPIAGVVRGLERNGALRVEDGAGVVHELRAGSLVFAQT
jgi:BirA family biotin operon repressor/biotin-[acetyl-CoA-carboxylase] ligase